MAEKQRPVSETGSIGSVAIDASREDPTVKRVTATFIVNADEAIPLAVALKDAAHKVLKELGIAHHGKLVIDKLGTADAMKEPS